LDSPELRVTNFLFSMLSFKNKDKKENLSIISQNIDFKEKVPAQPLTEIPESLAESFLYKKVK